MFTEILFIRNQNGRRKRGFELQEQQSLYRTSRGAQLILDCKFYKINVFSNILWSAEHYEGLQQK